MKTPFVLLAFFPVFLNAAQQTNEEPAAPLDRLQKAAAAAQHAGSWTAPQWSMFVFALAALVGMFVFAYFLYGHWKKRPDPGHAQPAQTIDDGYFRSQLARNLTTGALIFLAILASIVMCCAGIYAFVPPFDKERATLFFDMAKYIMAELVPIVAGWVGTVLAFYFGKENFEAATKSIRETAAVLTSQDKLAATPIRILGRAIQDANCYLMQTNDPNAAKSETLDVIEAKFTKAGKTYERLPVLFANGTGNFVLHQSTLNDFLLTMKRANPPKEGNICSISDLFSAEPWLPERSFVTVGPAATAAQAKTTMEKVKECSDVFVTVDGTPKGAVVRWITNVDLLLAAQV